jgi:peroxiredoxin
MMAGRIIEKSTAPDFTLMDTNDKEVRLSNFRGKKSIVLVFNRGFG